MDKDNRQISVSLDKLHDSLNTDSIETLKEQVGGIISNLKEQNHKRLERYNQQLEFLGNKLREMRKELDTTKSKLA